VKSTQQKIQSYLQRFVERCDGLWIVGFSGGADSVALVHVLSNMGVRLHLFHMNYGLRGEESEEDMAFCQRFATEQGLPLAVVRAEDVQSNWKEKRNLQEAARDLRYQCMKQLANELGASWMAVAHHQADQAETILHQFVRGGHLAALRGMPEQRDQLIRPFLHVPKELIEDYVQELELPFRTDSSNANTKYTRNKIRHELMDALRELNPDIVSSVAERAPYFAEMEQMMLAETNAALSSMAHQDTLDLSWFQNYPYKRVLLWQWLKPHGFGPHAVDAALQLLHSETGACVKSNTHELWREREALVLRPQLQTAFQETLLFPGNIGEELNVALSMRLIDVRDVDFSNKKAIYLDMTKIAWPICLRTWRTGDRIVPFGMNGSQKVSDALTQAKVPSSERATALVLCDNQEETIWVLGHKVSNLFRVDNQTHEVLEISMK
jgi:tRNA(Ile)-lysidine synthase